MGVNDKIKRNMNVSTTVNSLTVVAGDCVKYFRILYDKLYSGLSGRKK